MEIVSIDLFTVPGESRDKFLNESQKIRRFIKTIPGFVEGFMYEKKDGDSEYNFITTAVWKNEQAFENAGKTIAEEFQKQGFNPGEMFKKRNIQRMRSEYHRSPY